MGGIVVRGLVLACLGWMIPVLVWAQAPAPVVDGASLNPPVPSPSVTAKTGQSHTAKADEQGQKLFRPRTITTNLDLTYYRVKVGSLSMVYKLDPARQTAVLEMHTAVNINVLFLTYKRRSDVVANFNADGLLSFSADVTEDDNRRTALSGRLEAATNEIVIEGQVEDKPFTARIPRNSFRFTSVETYPYLGAMIGTRQTFSMLNLETGEVEKTTVEGLGREECPSKVGGWCWKVRREAADNKGDFLYTPGAQLVYGSGEDKRGSYTMRFASTKSASAPLPERKDSSLSQFWNFLKKMGTPPEEGKPAKAEKPSAQEKDTTQTPSQSVAP